MRETEQNILGMLRTLDQDDKADWKSQVNNMTHAYSCTRNETTGYAPYYLLFGRAPRLPLEIVFGIRQKDDKREVKKWAGQRGP